MKSNCIYVWLAAIAGLLSVAVVVIVFLRVNRTHRSRKCMNLMRRPRATFSRPAAPHCERDERHRKETRG